MNRETTVCVLNWRRPENLQRILAGLRAQTPPVDVFVWNNGPPIEADCDWLIQSSRNAFCPPRWWMLAQASTRYAVALDDDLFPAHTNSIATLVGHCVAGRCVGPIGAIFAGKKYSQHLTIREPVDDVPVAVVKGRCLAVCVPTLRDAVCSSGMLTARREKWPDGECEDDIAICGAVSHGSHYTNCVPGGLFGLFVDLDEKGSGLSHLANHMDRRDRVAARWFP